MYSGRVNFKVDAFLTSAVGRGYLSAARSGGPQGSEQEVVLAGNVTRFIQNEGEGKEK